MTILETEAREKGSEAATFESISPPPQASPSALSSPLWFHAPLLAPAFPARYRLSATARVVLAGLAATWAGLIAARFWPALGGVQSYARYDLARMR